jgi:hypothetical protein
MVTFLNVVKKTLANTASKIKNLIQTFIGVKNVPRVIISQKDVRYQRIT